MIVTDKANEEKLGSQVESLRKLGIQVELGDHRPAIFEQADMIVISPGVPHEIEPVRMAANQGIPVIGEIETFEISGKLLTQHNKKVYTSSINSA